MPYRCASFVAARLGPLPSASSSVAGDITGGAGDAADAAACLGLTSSPIVMPEPSFASCKSMFTWPCAPRCSAGGVAALPAVCIHEEAARPAAGAADMADESVGVAQSTREAGWVHEEGTTAAHPHPRLQD